MNQHAIVATNISKRYRIGLTEDPRKTLANTLLTAIKSPVENWRRLRQLTNFGNGENSDDIIWALKDVSFSVEPGEVVGVIGRNGAGKSTLLKVISRITHPTHGRLELRGQVSSLLEVGTGFHPELTGRENVFLNGTILGMRRKEIEQKFDEIVDFSGVEKFIDTPIKRYSTGMRVRLAFSVAAHLEPEILLVDEVLAVGDALFQKKSLGKMKSVAQHGRTVLFVSHQMDAIRSLCPRTLLMADGRLADDGETNKVVDHYMKLANQESDAAVWHGAAVFDSIDRGMTLESICVHDHTGLTKSEFRDDENIHISISYRLDKSFKGLGVKMNIIDDLGSNVLTTVDNLVLDETTTRGPGSYTSTCVIPAMTMNEGRYIVRVWGRISTGPLLHKRDINYVTFSIFRTHNTVAIKEPFLGYFNPNLPQWVVESSR